MDLKQIRKYALVGAASSVATWLLILTHDHIKENGMKEGRRLEREVLSNKIADDSIKLTKYAAELVASANSEPINLFSTNLKVAERYASNAITKAVSSSNSTYNKGLLYLGVAQAYQDLAVEIGNAEILNYQRNR